MLSSRLLVALGFAGALSLPNPAAAQDESPAENLFNQGLEAMEAGNYEKGCPAIAESQRLDPRPGTLFTLAECEAKRGRIATAVSRYDEYLLIYASMTPDKQAKQYGRDKVAAQQKALLQPHVPQLVLKLPPNAPPGTVVLRDGAVLSEAALGVALPVDPGEHVITTQPPGGVVNEQRIPVATGEKKEVVLDIKLGPEPPPPPPSTALTTAQQPTLPPPPPPPDNGSSGRRVGMYVAGGAGALGIVLGGIMGAVTIAQKGTVSDHCDADLRCDDQGLSAVNTAQTTGLVSTIGFGVGIAGLGAAAILFFTDPSRSQKPTAAKTSARRVSPGVLSVDRSGAVLGLEGGF